MKKSGFSIFEHFSMILREHAESLLLAIFLALVVRFFVFSTFLVKSDSMAPTLIEGELVLGFRTPFGLDVPGLGQLTRGRMPRAGELVVLKCPSGLCLNRVVAGPGDRIEMKNQRLIINDTLCRYEPAGTGGTILRESCPTFNAPVHLSPDWQVESWDPLVVPPEHVFLLNDNRGDLGDSRRWGPVHVGDVKAKAMARWLSLNWGASKKAPWLRWDRSFSRLN